MNKIDRARQAYLAAAVKQRHVEHQHGRDSAEHWYAVNQTLDAYRRLCMERGDYLVLKSPSLRQEPHPGR